MNIGTARAIFDSIENEGISVEEKGLAVRMILDMETHNSVRKSDMLKVMDWLWHQSFEMKQEGEQNETD